MPQSLEWFHDQGLGLFIHWAPDGQLGTIISHSLAGSSDAFASKYFQELPTTFDPTEFHPDALARLARVSGFRYMVFTTKHHNGFCMWDSATTNFDVAHTPYRKDLTAELFDAFRKQDLAVGAYFSPDDFLWLHQHGHAIQRLVPGVQPKANPGLMDLDRKQVLELMTRYGKISVFFFDGEAQGLRDEVWKAQRQTVITRGAMETPEQNIPGAPLPGVWEANMTLGSAWGYQPTDERYKTAEEIIHSLVQIRARGGNLLLNVGLEPDGSLPKEQEQLLRALGSWMFINGDAIYATRPWVITNEGPLWFTRSKDGKSLYIIVDEENSNAAWARGTRREFVLKTVSASPASTVSVLGQSDDLVEYRPGLDAHSRLHQEPDGLHLSVMRAQRLRDDDRWPYPTVIRLTDVTQAFTPPSVTTQAPKRREGDTILLTGSWSGAAPADGALFGFEYRVITGEDKQSRLHGWQKTQLVTATRPGTYSLSLRLNPADEYEVRSVLVHPMLTLYGQPEKIPAR